VIDGVRRAGSKCFGPQTNEVHVMRSTGPRRRHRLQDIGTMPAQRIQKRPGRESENTAVPVMPSPGEKRSGLRLIRLLDESRDFERRCTGNHLALLDVAVPGRRGSGCDPESHQPTLGGKRGRMRHGIAEGQLIRSEEHTSELQSREKLVCRRLLEKKKATGPSLARSWP